MQLSWVIPKNKMITKRWVVMTVVKKESKAELMLQPVRFRILQCLLSGRQRTAQEIGLELVDVPPATLYRFVVASAGYPMRSAAFGIGALGWWIAYLLRIPVGLALK
jgi:hypothetical protein